MGIWLQSAYAFKFEKYGVGVAHVAGNVRCYATQRVVCKDSKTQMLMVQRMLQLQLVRIPNTALARSDSKRFGNLHYPQTFGYVNRSWVSTVRIRMQRKNKKSESYGIRHIFCNRTSCHLFEH